MSELIHLVVGGLIQAGVCDATIWGVHRFAATLLRKVYAAAFAPSVTPFILASTLTRHSDGLVRPMRRRRLRWDSADGSIPVRGKRGWVDHLATVAGVPMTLDELDTALRGSFQDYESYVLQQLNLDEDEEGEGNYGCRFVPGVSNRIPGILIPGGWEFDLARQNVSEGIRMLVTRIVAASTAVGLPQGAPAAGALAGPPLRARGLRGDAMGRAGGFRRGGSVRGGIGPRTGESAGRRKTTQSNRRADDIGGCG